MKMYRMKILDSIEYDINLTMINEYFQAHGSNYLEVLQIKSSLGLTSSKH